MKSAFKLFAVLVMLTCTVSIADAQFSNQHPDGVPMPPISERVKDRVGGPVAIGQQMLQRDDGGGVALIQSPAPPASGGGVIQLSAFGWLQPYVDTIVQALIVAGVGWLGKSKYTQWMDQSARDALELFAKNTASSLIADGFVHMSGKTVTVSNGALLNEANTAATRIPDALKRFGITPDLVASKIVDAIPQVAAGAAMIASAHTSAPSTNSNLPPTAATPA